MAVDDYVVVQLDSDKFEGLVQTNGRGYIAGGEIKYISGMIVRDYNIRRLVRAGDVYYITHMDGYTVDLSGKHHIRYQLFSGTEI